MFPPTLITNASESWHSSVSASDVSDQLCNELGQCRTVLNIVWSCLSVIFACTWLAFHPDVPDLDDGFWCRLYDRSRYTVLGLIAPETIMYYAAQEWWSAREIREELIRLDSQVDSKEHTIVEADSTVDSDEHTTVEVDSTVDGTRRHLLDNVRKETQWTVTHGFFLKMGGFVAVEVDSNMTPVRTVTNMWNYMGDYDIRKAFAFFTKEDIEDKSKRSSLAKVIVCGQTAWFVAQCVVRAAQGLAITQLEVATVAFAVMNFVTYFFWWNKPSDVDRPIRVKLSSDVMRRVPIRLNFDDSEGFGYSYNGMMLMGSIFGGIHCLAWSEHFPSLAETWLWRSSALTVTCLPTLAAVVLILQYKFGFDSEDRLFPTVSIFYAIARVILLVQAFALLRSLPLSAYQTVEWTTFIPHIQ